MEYLRRYCNRAGLHLYRFTSMLELKMKGSLGMSAVLGQHNVNIDINANFVNLEGIKTKYGEGEPWKKTALVYGRTKKSRAPEQYATRAAHQ